MWAWLVECSFVWPLEIVKPEISRRVGSWRDERQGAGLVAVERLHWRAKRRKKGLLARLSLAAVSKLARVAKRLLMGRRKAHFCPSLVAKLIKLICRLAAKLRARRATKLGRLAPLRFGFVWGARSPLSASLPRACRELDASLPRACYELKQCHQPPDWLDWPAPNRRPIGNLPPRLAASRGA